MTGTFYWGFNNMLSNLLVKTGRFDNMLSNLPVKTARFDNTFRNLIISKRLVNSIKSWQNYSSIL